MDIKSPKSEPTKSIEKLNTEKAEHQEIARKPDDKPKIENKIERSKIDITKEPRNKIQREKIDIHTPARNKIERSKIDMTKEPKNKIQREKIDLSTPARNKIKRPKVDITKEPRNKIQSYKPTPKKDITNIERFPTSQPKTSIQSEVKQPSLEQIKQEITKVNWRKITENWTTKVYSNENFKVNPFELPSKTNPIYKHKEWLKTVYKHNKWNLNDDMVAKICGVSNATIYKWRKKFNIPTKQPFKQPFNDGKQKECGRCHQIKPHNEFGLRNDKRKEKPYLRSNCNQCKSELNQIYIFKNKHKILTNIYNGKFKGKCPECETRFSKLPAFDFHHLDNNYKLTKRIRFRGNWEKTMERLEREKTIPICKNCHSIKQATVFNKYEKIISRKSNFESSFEGLEKNIHKYMRTRLKYEKFDEIRQIKPWIKKRIVTEKLFNGKCVACSEDKLPTLQFHHKDPKQKTYQKWSGLSNLNVSRIIKKLREDDVVCLCANCHSITESRHFEKNMGEILENKDLDELRIYYKKLNQRIKDYSFPNQHGKNKI